MTAIRRLIPIIVFGFLNPGHEPIPGLDHTCDLQSNKERFPWLPPMGRPGMSVLRTDVQFERVRRIEFRVTYCTV